MITLHKKFFLLMTCILFTAHQPLQANESTSYWSDIFKDGKTFLTYCVVSYVFVHFCWRLYCNSKKKPNISTKEPLKNPSRVPNINLKNCIGIPERVIGLVEQIKESSTNPTFSMPKDFLFFGDAGMGKCFLTKAIAGELQAPFFSVDVGLCIGLSGAVCWGKIESAFQKAKDAIKNKSEDEAKNRAISIVFIDNIDLLPSGCVNKLVKKIDSKNSKDDAAHVIVIAATNSFNNVNEALTRSDRFENCIKIDLPTEQDRQEKIQQLFKKFFTQHYFAHGNVSEGRWAKNWEQVVSSSSSSEDIQLAELVESNIQDTLSCRLARATTGMSFIEIEQLVRRVSEDHDKPQPRAFVKELWDRFYVNHYQKSLASKGEKQEAYNSLGMLPIYYDEFSSMVDKMSSRSLNELVASVQKSYRDFSLKKLNDASQEEQNIMSFFNEKCENINQKINNDLVKKAESLCVSILPRKLTLNFSPSNPDEVMSLYGVRLQPVVDYS